MDKLEFLFLVAAGLAVFAAILRNALKREVRCREGEENTS